MVQVIGINLSLKLINLNLIYLKIDHKNMKHNINYSVVLVSVLGLFFQFSSLSAQSAIDLGDLTAFSTSASQEPFSFSALDEAFNGVVDVSTDNFRARAVDITTLSWSVNPFENTQVDTTLFDTVRYTINIYTGLVGSEQGVNGKDIISFFMRFAEADESFGQYNTDFDSLSTQEIATGVFHDLTVDPTTAEISTDKSARQVLHSLTFSVPHTVSKFELFLPSESTGSAEGVFSIEEIVTSAEAIAVPEPTSIGLSMGFFVLIFRFFISRRR